MKTKQKLEGRERVGAKKCKESNVHFSTKQNKKKWEKKKQKKYIERNHERKETGPTRPLILLSAVVVVSHIYFWSVIDFVSKYVKERLKHILPVCAYGVYSKRSGTSVNASVQNGLMQHSTNLGVIHVGRCFTSRRHNLWAYSGTEPQLYTVYILRCK